jgi:ribulose kinase
VGTVSIRAAIHDEDDGALIADAVEPVRIHGRRGVREIDFEDVWRRLERVIDRLAGGTMGARIEVTRVGIAATASSVAPLDGDLRPTGRGLLWADHRAAPEAAEIAATGHPVLGRTLGHVSPEWGLPKLLHLWRSGDTARRTQRSSARVVHVLELIDWLDWKLTGRLVANAGIREWGWCVDDAGVWPADLVAAVGLGDALGLVATESAVTGQELGPLGAEVAARHPLLARASVTMGGMDSYMAALGQGVIAPGRLAASFGSSSSLVARTGMGAAAGWLYGPLRRILPGPPDGYWHGGQSTAGLAVDLVAALVGRSWQQLEPLASLVAPGSDGLVFRETLLDRRTPWPESGLRGVFDGLSLAHRPEHLVRAALEGVAFGSRLAASPLRPDDVVVTGGLAESALFRAVLAQSIGRPVGTVRHRAAAVFGAAFAHAPDRIANLNPIAAWVDPAPRTQELEAAYARYIGLHRLPRSVGAVPAGTRAAAA